MRELRRYQVRGIVQGVGFRPFVYRTALKLQLNGWIRNDSEGVVLEVQGTPDTLERFILQVRSEAPALARVESVELLERRDAEEQSLTMGFEIHVSEHTTGAHTLVSPDCCVCDDCLRELLDPEDRRYGYPFINCTNCGPRYSIIRGVPYDREMTTMAMFEMCERCEREYRDVADRRFHAQPVACWDCGPQVSLWDPRDGPLQSLDPIADAVSLLRDGAIVAVKGIGGFHLMVDARDEHAVAELRRRKRREEKPFALMSPTLAQVSAYAHFDEHEARLLRDVARPIVLLRKRADPASRADPLAAGIAPGNHHYGVMLAYTPLHHLLFGESFDVLVATSGNIADEPIAFHNEDAARRLAGIADALLVTDREIFTRVDDSIVRVVSLGGASVVSPLRRARGYAPMPLPSPRTAPSLLAVGAELKSTVCVSREHELFLSHHIGDLGNDATRRSFEHAIDHLSRLLEVEPQLISHDMHPGYESTRFARAQQRLPTIAVQHHHAHMAACMCEHELSERVIGVIFDGTGYGTDGQIWGGEFLVGDYAGFERAAHLDYFRLPGADRAVREPYRVALALLAQAHGSFEKIDLPVVSDRSEQERHVLGRMIEAGIGSPLTSSMGRLFDGVAALLGVRECCHYEAQAAIELEQLIPSSATSESGRGGRPLEWGLHEGEGPLRIDLGPLVRELTEEASRRDTCVSELSLRFHRTVIEIVRHTCGLIREASSIERVVLSGGVFQNEFLLRGCFAALADAGFEVHAHRRVPANDGGVSLGQAAVAAWASG